MDPLAWGRQRVSRLLISAFDKLEFAYRTTLTLFSLAAACSSHITCPPIHRISL